MTVVSSTGRASLLRWFAMEDPDDRAAYRAVWQRSQFRRPHDHPGFLDLMRPAGYDASAVVYQAGDGTIIYPFFHCRLNDLPAFRSLQEVSHHLVSPYGYGGALYEGGTEHLSDVSEAFEGALQKDLNGRGFITEFVRQDIFASRLVLRKQGEVLVQQPNVVVRLRRTDDDIWRTYRPKVRKNVSRAKEAGLTALFERTGDHLGSFLDIYHETMERTEATRSFFIGRERFEELNRTLGRDGGLMYVYVFDGADCVSTELLLLSSDTVYSFLGGTRAAAFDKRPNDFLKHEVIRWARDQGFAWYVLGGGVLPGDGIYKYKESFDPGGIIPFTVRRVIHNRAVYDSLVEERRRYEQGQGKDWNPRSDYFPGYLS